jgi:hypothetical protein
MEKNLTFSAALVRLKKGDEIARAAWPEGITLSLEENDIIESKGGDEFGETWEPSIEAILAEDWMVTREAGEEEDENEGDE